MVIRKWRWSVTGLSLVPLPDVTDVTLKPNVCTFSQARTHTCSPFNSVITDSCHTGLCHSTLWNYAESTDASPCRKYAQKENVDHSSNSCYFTVHTHTETRISFEGRVDEHNLTPPSCRGLLGDVINYQHKTGDVHTHTHTHSHTHTHTHTHTNTDGRRRRSGGGGDGCFKAYAFSGTPWSDSPTILLTKAELAK